MSFPLYPEYKDSGVEWLGEVPAHWGVMPFKWQVDRNDGGAWGEDPNGNDGDTVVLRSTDQTVDGHWRIEDPAIRNLAPREKRSTRLEEGDLVVTKSSGSSLHIGKTTFVTREVADLRCGFGNFMQRIRTRASFAPKLAWYVLNNDIARFQLDLLSNSTTGLANLNGTLIGEILLTVPPVSEQRAIVAFLDFETARIDALIEEQQRLIELLKEKRQAVISHAVTKGLDPDVPMKDSGVKWLGEVPAHWEVTPLKYILLEPVQMGPFGSSLTDLEESPTGFKLYGQENYITGDFGRGSRWVTPILFERLKKYELRTGDLVFTRKGSIGNCRRVPVGIDRGIIDSDSIRVRVDPALAEPEFTELLAHEAWYVAEQLHSERRGAVLSGLNSSNIANLKLLVPPLTEQREVVRFVTSESQQMNATLEASREAVRLLAERRSALISAAVTGKIDVRGWCAESNDAETDLPMVAEPGADYLAQETRA
ncbi:restriction endonuclease subunit S [Guyparkeria sp.]|uniref:restriction endonuclease subunit S n=1 Tax=Guyparkeria sp. TaxID=2035736 RepID=UPI003970ABD0